jgi:hypothetical protein
MTTTKITQQGEQTLEELREIAVDSLDNFSWQLFKQVRAERKLRQAGVKPANRYDELSAAQKRHVDVYINNLASGG